MIRELKTSEFDKVAPIYNLGRTDELNTISSSLLLTPWEVDQYIQSVLYQSRIFVYEESSSIIGFCGIHGSKLNWLFVLAEHRRRGVAGSLIKEVLKEYQSLSLTVAASNEAAFKLYRSLGFTKTREFQVEFQSKQIDVINMDFHTKKI